jgi:hypothetical protein
VTRYLPVLLLVLALARPALALEPIPDRLVVLTFDDASKSHHDVARPLLLKYKFGATFFVCEGFDFPTNKKDYMTWEEITRLHKDGFEKQTNNNKVFASPFAACKDATGKRWVVTGWERCGRAWGNPPCP